MVSYRLERGKEVIEGKLYGGEYPRWWWVHRISGWYSSNALYTKHEDTCSPPCSDGIMLKFHPMNEREARAMAHRYNAYPALTKAVRIALNHLGDTDASDEIYDALGEFLESIPCGRQ